jgi:hypothetical protein
MSYAARTDANQAAIVAALRAAGCTVHCTHRVGHGFPDLVVGKHGVTVLMEVKQPGCKPNRAERLWYKAWDGGPLFIVHNVDEALAVAGCMAAGHVPQNIKGG